MKFLRRTIAAIASILNGRGRKTKAAQSNAAAPATDEPVGRA